MLTGNNLPNSLAYFSKRTPELFCFCLMLSYEPAERDIDNAFSVQVPNCLPQKT